MRASERAPKGSPRRTATVAAAVATLSTLALATSAPARADFEIAGFLRGLGPNAGGASLAGLKARFGGIEATAIQYEYGGSALGLGYRKELREKGWIVPSVALTGRWWIDETAVGPGLGLTLAPIHFGSLGVGVRLDNDLLYLVVAKQFMPEYLLGVTLTWD